jgi:hypothetical protein
VIGDDIEGTTIMAKVLMNLMPANRTFTYSMGISFNAISDKRFTHISFLEHTRNLTLGKCWEIVWGFNDANVTTRIHRRTTIHMSGNN